MGALGQTRGGAGGLDVIEQHGVVAGGDDARAHILTAVQADELAFARGGAGGRGDRGAVHGDVVHAHPGGGDGGGGAHGDLIARLADAAVDLPAGERLAAVRREAALG